MFSKWRLMAVIMAALMVFQGCGLNTGEKPSPAASPSFSGRGYSCVGQIPTHLEKYAADELDEAQITDFVRCLQRAFTSFTQLTRGRDELVYTPDEIRRFLQTYFLRERPITDELLQQFMNLKQVVIGGRTDQITRPEISRLIEILEDLRVEAIRLKPQIRFLNPRLVLQQDPASLGDKLKEANQALTETIRVLSGYLKKGTRNYPFDDLEVLMDEFRQFVRWDEHFDKGHASRSWVEFLKVFKSAAVSPEDPDVLRPQDWAPFLDQLSRWYLAFIEYRVGIQNQPKLFGVGLQNTLHFAEEVFNLTKDALKRQKNQTLTMAQMSALVTAAQDLNWLTAGVRSSSVDKTLRALLTKVFADENGRSKKKQVVGLDREVLDQIELEFYRWADIQLKLNARYSLEAMKKQSVAPAVPNLQSRFYIPLDVRTKLRSYREGDWDDFLKIRDMARPLFNDNLARVTLVPDGEMGRYHVTHEFSNLSMMNTFRTAVALLFRGYAADKNRRTWDGGMKSAELQAFYEDVRDLAIDLGFADRRVVNTGARAFVEGNLFTFSAGGIGSDVEKARLTYMEAMELLAFLYSGGLAANDFATRLEGRSEGQASCPLGPADLNGSATFERGCVAKLMPELLEQSAQNLPGLLGYLRSVPPDVRSRFISNVIQTAYSPTNSNPDWVERSELSIMAVILHYLESVLIRYDANEDGLLTNDEISRATPVFVGYIQKFAREQMKTELDAKQAEGVFRYILVYKSIPSKWNFVRVFKLSKNLYWEFDIPWVGTIKLDLNQEISIDRADLSEVFTAIVSKIFSTSPSAAQSNN